MPLCVCSACPIVRSLVRSLAPAPPIIRPLPPIPPFPLTCLFLPNSPHPINLPPALLCPSDTSARLSAPLTTSAHRSDHPTTSVHPSTSAHSDTPAHSSVSLQPSAHSSAFMRCLQLHLRLLVCCRTHRHSSARSRAHPTLCSLTLCLHFALLNLFSISLGDQHLPPDCTLRAS